MKTKLSLIAFSLIVGSSSLNAAYVLYSYNIFVGYMPSESWEVAGIDYKLYHYRIDSNAYFPWLGGYASHKDIYNFVASCSAGYEPDSVHQVCTLINLSNYDNDSVKCSLRGGYFYSTGVEMVGGTSYGASFFGGKGIVIGGELTSITKCGTLGDVVGQVASTALGLVPFASKWFKALRLKKLANIEWIHVLEKYNQPGGFKDSAGRPVGFPDTFVGLPKLPVPGSPSMAPTIPIKQTPVPQITNASGTGPSRSADVQVDPGYSKIDDVHIPVKANGDPLVDYSTVDLVNVWNTATREFRDYQLAHPEIYPTPLPQARLSDVVPKTFSYSAPVKETFDLSKMMPDSSEPSTIATVLSNTTKTRIYSGSDPIDIYKTTKQYVKRGVKFCSFF